MASAERPNWAPDSIDLERPNAARVYDYMLGGAANFAQDRAFAERLLETMPEARSAARLNRAFLRRAVRYCVEEGIRQFVDIGSGIPTGGNVHEIAQRIDPSCRVLYVDNEPVAVTHSELMLQDNDRTGTVHGDLVDPDSILDAAQTRRLIDFAEPVALLMVAVLHFVPDSANPQAAVERYKAAMAPGSLLVLSHGIEIAKERADRVDKLYEDNPTRGVGRRYEDVAGFFSGLELVEPGLVWTPQWRPESPEDVGDNPESAVIVAGVARKP